MFSGVCARDRLQSTGLANRTGLLHGPPSFHSGNKGCRETAPGKEMMHLWPRVPSSCRWLFKNLHLGNYLRSPVVSKWRIGSSKASDGSWARPEIPPLKALNIPGSSTAGPTEKSGGCVAGVGTSEPYMHEPQQETLEFVSFLFFKLVIFFFLPYKLTGILYS